MFLVDSLPELKDEGLEDEGGKWASSVNFCLFACGVTLVDFFVGILSLGGVGFDADYVVDYSASVL